MKVKSKLVGEEDDRGVSPVIGVILMVAVTVILAAVISAFVLDLGGSVEKEPRAGVSVEVDENPESGSAVAELEVTLVSLENADYVTLGGDVGNGQGLMDVGVATNCEVSSSDPQVGTLTVVAVDNETDTKTVVGTEEYDVR